MGATKRLFERMFDHDYHEIRFRMLEQEYFMKCLDEMTKEEIEYTCCGDEITGEVEDVGLCPTCFEHI
jgi:hypothetical protein